jgi:hypothetical protein
MLDSLNAFSGGVGKVSGGSPNVVKRRHWDLITALPEARLLPHLALSNSFT